MIDELPPEELLGAVDRLVREVLDEAALREPPVDAVALALQFLPPQEQRPRRGQRRPAVAQEQTEEQKQWAAARQLGRHLKDVLLERLGVAEEAARGLPGATLVNLFAPRLLLPADWFAADAAALDYDVLRLKERYPTCTHEVIALRLLDLPEPCIITVLDGDRVHRRRSNAWPVRRPLEPAEQKCQRTIQRHGQPHVIRADNWTVQGWPIRETDGQRIILRSVVET